MMRAYVYGDRCISSTGKSGGNDLENHHDKFKPEIRAHVLALLGLGVEIKNNDLPAVHAPSDTQSSKALAGRLR